MKFEINLERLNELKFNKCPCVIEEKQDNKCPCKIFTTEGKCICGTFKKLEE